MKRRTVKKREARYWRDGRIGLKNARGVHDVATKRAMAIAELRDIVNFETSIFCSPKWPVEITVGRVTVGETPGDFGPQPDGQIRIGELTSLQSIGINDEFKTDAGSFEVVVKDEGGRDGEE